MLEIVPMSEAEFRRYMETAVEEYAQSHIQAGDVDPAEAHELAKADYDELLPQGLASPGQHLFSIRAAGIDDPMVMAPTRCAGQKH